MGLLKGAENFAVRNLVCFLNFLATLLYTKSINDLEFLNEVCRLKSDFAVVESTATNA